MYTPQLGVVPAVAVAIIQDAPSIINGLAHLFGINTNGSYDQTHARILQYVQIILHDPEGALGAPTPIPQTGGAGWTYSAANALLGLRCWAGDQTILPLVMQLDPPTAENGNYHYTNGCGCETAHGCRADAQQALAAVDAQLKRLNPPVSSAPIPSDPTSGQTTPTGTVYTTLPGGISVGLPVPTSTLTTATLFGVPIWALGLGLAGLAFAGGRRGRS